MNIDLSVTTKVMGLKNGLSLWNNSMGTTSIAKNDGEIVPFERLSGNEALAFEGYTFDEKLVAIPAKNGGIYLFDGADFLIGPGTCIEHFDNVLCVAIPSHSPALIHYLYDYETGEQIPLTAIDGTALDGFYFPRSLCKNDLLFSSSNASCCFFMSFSFSSSCACSSSFSLSNASAFS